MNRDHHSYRIAAKPALVLLAWSVYIVTAWAAPDGGLGGALGRLESGLTGGVAGKAVAQPHARAELVADTTAIESGKPFRLGVRFTIDPGWHIYWKNSGDSGLATSIEWNLPEGFRVGELQWPAPQRVEVSGLINYGYHDQVMLLAQATPPATLSGGPARLAAKAKWLVCREICVPGEADVALALPIGKAEPSPQAALFEKEAVRVPKPYSAVDAGVRGALRWIGPEQAIAIAPGKERTVDIGMDVSAPWRIDTRAAGIDEPAIFPLASETWEGTHPQRKELTEHGMVYQWILQPRPQARPTESGEVRAVARLPLVNAATGERETVVFERPLPIRIAAAGSKNWSPARELGASGTDRKASTAVGEQPGVKGTSATGSPSGGLSFLKATGVQRSPWWYFLLLAFLGGMILNVMPCVLPVISLKVMSFVRQAEEERGRVLRLGLAYGAGVLASFAALAAAVVALKAAGTQVGWGFQLQEPRFVIAMTAVVLAFALSLFGVFTVELPGAATARLADGASREGYGGSFVSGVLATALATPCVGPLLGVALGFAFTQAAWVIVVFFLTVGAGLAAPYVLLAANPAWLRALPRAGPWMETVKHLMGFALVGTLVWLLSVLGGQLGTQGMAETLAFLAAVALGCWLIGLGQRPWSGRWTSRMTWALALAAVAVGYAFFPGRFLRNWSPEGAGSQRVASLRTTGGIEWLPFSLARVEELVADRRTVFLDFTADWCLTCKVNEKGTLASARVAAAFKRHGVAAVRADWTTRDETIRRVLAQLGASGVPLYVILPAERPEQPIMLPSLLTPGLIEEKLEKAAGTMSVAYNP